MADLLPEAWMKGVAVTTTCLAVMTAIAAARGAACAAKTQFLNTTESSLWASVVFFKSASYVLQ